MTTESKTSLSSRLFRLDLWVLTFTAWITFGTATLLNGVALERLNDFFPGYGIVNLPNNMREAIWLVLGIWAGGYIGAFICGLLWQDRPGYHASTVWSAVLGYEIAVGMRMILIGYFPDVGHEAFTEILDIFYLKALPTYPAFFIMVMGLGALMVGLAVVTGSFTSSGAFSDMLPKPKIDGATVVVAALLPMTLLFLRLAILNIRDIDLAPGVEATGGRTAGILYIDSLVNPFANMLVAAWVGIRFGRKYLQRLQSDIIYSSAVGVMIHLLVLVMIYQVLTMYEPELGKGHALHLLLPNYRNWTIEIWRLTITVPRYVFWLLLWMGPVLAAATVAYVSQVVLRSLFGSYPAGDAPVQKSSQPTV